jgi:hypothetical protein
MEPSQASHKTKTANGCTHVVCSTTRADTKIVSIPKKQIKLARDDYVKLQLQSLSAANDSSSGDQQWFEERLDTIGRGQ